jgi:hypothetical protein
LHRRGWSYQQCTSNLLCLCQVIAYKEENNKLFAHFNCVIFLSLFLSSYLSLFLSCTLCPSLPPSPSHPLPLSPTHKHIHLFSTYGPCILQLCHFSFSLPLHLTLNLSHLYALCLSLSPILFPYLTVCRSLSLSLNHTHAHIHTSSLNDLSTLILCPFCFYLPLKLTPLFLTRPISFTLSLSHTHPASLFPSRTHTHAHYLSMVLTSLKLNYCL